MPKHGIRGIGPPVGHRDKPLTDPRGAKQELAFGEAERGEAPSLHDPLVETDLVHQALRGHSQQVVPVRGDVRGGPGVHESLQLGQGEEIPFSLDSAITPSEKMAM